VGEAKQFRKRLEALTRQALSETARGPASADEIRRAMQRLRQLSRERRLQPILYRRDLPQPSRSLPTYPVPPGEAVTLEQAVKGIEWRVPGWGRAYVIETRPAEQEEAPRGLRSALHRALSPEGFPLRRSLAQLSGSEAILPGDLMFLDIETTGLSGTPLFLIGTMQSEGGELVVRQYFARDYSEEAAVIVLGAELLARKKVLITFNGKSFDMPYLRTRAAATGVRLCREPAHFDLLHACRRVWRGVLPDCRLQTLESRICGRWRYGDIPSSEIPKAYHAYVHTGNAAVIVQILRHNTLDLVTMAELAVRFPLPAAAG